MAYYVRHAEVALACSLNRAGVKSQTNRHKPRAESRIMCGHPNASREGVLIFIDFVRLFSTFHEVH